MSLEKAEVKQFGVAVSDTALKIYTLNPGGGQHSSVVMDLDQIDDLLLCFQSVGIDWRVVESDAQ